jgi:uncharacterized phage infection (PIP) family protein YhgE
MNPVENGSDTPQSAGVEDGNDTDDLDALLSSYETDRGGQKDSREPKSNGNGDMPEWAKEFLKRQEQIEARQNELEKGVKLESQRSDLNKAIETIKKSEGPLSKLKNSWIEAQLLYRADRDPRIETAFAKRNVDPKAWKKVLGALAKDFAADLEDDSGSDVDAVVASSRNVSTRRPAGDAELAKKISNMSDTEFAQYASQMARAKR